MTTLLILLILIGLGLYGVKEYYQIKLGIIPKTLAAPVLVSLAGMLEALTIREDKSGRFLHLGSGYGLTVLTLARSLPAWQIDGLEQNPTPWLLANFRSVGKNFGNYRFFVGDFLTWPLKDYDVIFLNQSEKTLTRWEGSIARRLVAGTLLVSLNTRLPHVQPSETITIEGNNTLYTYKKKTAPKPETGPDDVTLQSVTAHVIPAPSSSLPHQPALPLEPHLDKMENPHSDVPQSLAE